MQKILLNLTFLTNFNSNDSIIQKIDDMLYTDRS